MKGQSLQFSYTNSGWWAGQDPFHLKFALRVTHPHSKNADFESDRITVLEHRLAAMCIETSNMLQINLQQKREGELIVTNVS